MPKEPLFKPLEWKNTDNGVWIAYSPVSRVSNGYVQIMFEQGKYWPIWDCALPGYDTLEQAQEQAQMHHEAFLWNYINKDYVK